MSKRFFSIILLLLLSTGLVAALAVLTTNKSDEATKTASVADGQSFSPNGTWSDLPPLPTVQLNWGTGGDCRGNPSHGMMPLKLKRAGAVAFPNGKIYILGGRHRADGDDINSQWIWEYTPGNNSYVRKNAVLDTCQYGSRFTSNMAVAVLTNTSGVRIYAVGGSSVNSAATNMVRVYDPVADTLSSDDNWPAAPTRIPGGYAVYNNKLYIFGGYVSQTSSVVYADTWVFDPMAASGSRWSQVNSANLSVARGFIAGATLDGYIYAIGGNVVTGVVSTTITPQSVVERMNPSAPSPSWQPVASLPTARGDMAAWAYDTNTNYEISGKIVAAGGPYPVPDTKAYIYDPVANNWSAFTDMMRPRRNMAYTQMDGILYAFGGYNYALPPTPTPQSLSFDGSNSSMAFQLMTNTPAPATNTPTRTATRTNTPVPPSNTPALPTNTPMPPTNTPVPPTATATACAIQFTDVDPSHTFYSFIRCLACRNIISGYTTGCVTGNPCFRPENNVTRGQVAKIVSNAAGFTEPVTAQSFQDVEVGSTFYEVIGRLATRGIVNGYACGGPGEPCVPPLNLPYFRPNNNVTRGQLAKIDSEAAGYNDVPSGQQFEDVAQGSTFYTYTYRLAIRTILSGYACGGSGEPCNPPLNLPYLRYANPATRGQTSKIVGNTFYPSCNTPQK